MLNPWSRCRWRNRPSPAATAAPEPADEPLLPSLVSQGFLVVPPYQTSPLASAPRVSLAIIARRRHPPAAARRWHRHRAAAPGRARRPTASDSRAPPAGPWRPRGCRAGDRDSKSARDLVISAFRLLDGEVFGIGGDAFQNWGSKRLSRLRYISVSSSEVTWRRADELGELGERHRRRPLRDRPGASPAPPRSWRRFRGTGTGSGSAALTLKLSASGTLLSRSAARMPCVLARGGR